MNSARRQAWAAIGARHGALPGVRIANKVLEGVTCIRLDATVTPARSDKELAEPNFKGFGHHPLLGYCDNTGEPLAGMMRRGSAGSNTTADHLQVLGDAITALPPKHRRRLMVTADGAGASHGLITRLDQLAARPGHQLTYSVGWELGARERDAIRLIQQEAWLALLLVVSNVPAGLRGWRAQLGYIDVAHRVHARVEDCIRTGKDRGIGRFPSHDFAMNSAWLAAALIAAALLSWLRPIALDGDLAKAEPKTLRRVLHAAGKLVRGGRRRRLKIPATWPWADAIATAWARVTALPQAP